MTDLGIAIIGALAGSFATLAWEAFIRPLRESRSFAEVLAADISLHAQAVLAELLQIQANPRIVPLLRPMPTALFAAIVGRIGELPRKLVGETLALYRILERLNEISERANEIYGSLKNLPEGDPAYPVLEAQLAESIALYGRFMENAKARINHVQPRLVKAAMPWWSPRFWTGPRPTTLKTEDMGKLIEDMDEHHAERIERIRKLS
jgi:hypothetical protein